MKLMGGIQNPGRCYRVMYCLTCGDFRFQTIDFLEVERCERGIFVWFRRRCSGVSGPNRKNENFYKRIKDCGKALVSHLPARQWAFLMADSYY